MNRDVTFSVRPDYQIKLYNKEGFLAIFKKAPSELEHLGKLEKMMLDGVQEGFGESGKESQEYGA